MMNKLGLALLVAFLGAYISLCFMLGDLRQTIQKVDRHQEAAYQKLLERIEAIK